MSATSTLSEHYATYGDSLLAHFGWMFLWFDSSSPLTLFSSDYPGQRTQSLLLFALFMVVCVLGLQYFFLALCLRCVDSARLRAQDVCLDWDAAQLIQLRRMQRSFAPRGETAYLLEMAVSSGAALDVPSKHAAAAAAVGSNPTLDALFTAPSSADEEDVAVEDEGGVDAKLVSSPVHRYDVFLSHQQSDCSLLKRTSARVA